MRFRELEKILKDDGWQYADTKGSRIATITNIRQSPEKLRYHFIKLT